MTDENEAETEEVVPEPRRAHRKLAVALTALAGLLSFLAIFAVWANRQLLNTDNWTDTSTELIQNDAIRTQVAAFLVDELYANVDVKAEVEQAFSQVLRPRGAAALSGPASGALRTLANKGVDQFLGRPRAQQIWENSNRRAHKRFLFVVEGGGDVVSTSGGKVTLDLSALLGETQSTLGVGGRVQKRLPASAAQIELFDSNELEAAQDAVRILKGAAIALVLVALALFALAVYLARGWRREALRACGISLAFAGAAALVARSLAGDSVVDAVATTDAVRPAADAAWSIGTSLLEQVATATLIYGIAIIVGAWLAGPTAAAVAVRRFLAPALREPRYAWGGFAVLVLVLVAWAPTPAFRLVVPALLIIALLALGVEMLRRQTLREFPDTGDGVPVGRRLAAWASGVREGVDERRAGGPAGAGRGEDDVAASLERLRRMRDDGLLDPAEFAAAKAKLLGT